MIFWDEIEQRALAARRQMVRSGELLSEDEFREQLNVSAGHFARMVARGSVFTIEVDCVDYYPSLLSAPNIDLKRLHAVCRILSPAPPSCRLGYLSSRHANIGGTSPIEALRDESQYRLLRRMAHAYAAEWSRTSVTIYVGRHQNEPSDTEPTLTAIDEVDPRVNIWKRTVGALQSGGYIHPCGPYPRAPVATVFIARHPAGQARATSEARIDVSVVDGIARAVIAIHEGPTYELDSIQVANEESIVDVVLRFAVAARKSESKSR
ncbi:hypothetical protein [Paraburkholderia ginsengisoli]|uniref:Uncharacterized protein n=1 Tax=Paraburkholderia ginsengisoli TaxID=311231 RepID=A0A7T4N0S3_9BURK|nr:hypothetical protein [Paraburkholderia ginsengisoli]QQC63126.1 hypothetical protein I6I06_12495 [Paraburkholderia ginsengisoli]